MRGPSGSCFLHSDPTDSRRTCRIYDNHLTAVWLQLQREKMKRKRDPFFPPPGDRHLISPPGCWAKQSRNETACFFFLPPLARKHSVKHFTTVPVIKSGPGDKRGSSGLDSDWELEWHKNGSFLIPESICRPPGDIRRRMSGETAEGDDRHQRKRSTKEKELHAKFRLWFRSYNNLCDHKFSCFICVNDSAAQVL